MIGRVKDVIEVFHRLGSRIDRVPAGRNGEIVGASLQGTSGAGRIVGRCSKMDDKVFGTAAMWNPEDVIEIPVYGWVPLIWTASSVPVVANSDLDWASATQSSNTAVTSD